MSQVIFREFRVLLKESESIIKQKLIKQLTTSLSRHNNSHKKVKSKLIFHSRHHPSVSRQTTDTVLPGENGKCQHVLISKSGWQMSQHFLPPPTFQSKGQKKVVSLPKVYRKERKAASFSIHRAISPDNRSNESTLIINKRVLIRSCSRTNKFSCRTKWGLKKRLSEGTCPLQNPGFMTYWTLVLRWC